MKKFAIFLSALALLFPAACAPEGETPGGNPADGSGEDEKIEITLWSYPVGGWNKSSTISSQLSPFLRENPDIAVRVEVVEYGSDEGSGDSKINAAIEKGGLPDIVLEGPERLVANWGERDLMVPLNDLWEEENAKAIDGSVERACRDGAGNYYIYPMCMTTHCMAINYDLFKKADALQYIDEETHTWTREGFLGAVEKLHEYGMEEVAAVYCKGQAGDQGTRALVTNLFGGTFTNAEHTRYTLDTPENIQALELLQSTQGIVFDETLDGVGEIEKFCKEELAMALCWNVANDITQTSNGNLKFNVFPMAFPTANAETQPELQGGIWGFGIFDNKDEKKIEAAKKLIRYLSGDGYEHAVTVSTYLPVRDLPGIYDNNKKMNEYGIFRRYLGDYYQVTDNWANARTLWWTMLQEIGEGGDVTQAVEKFSAGANKKN